MPEAEPRSVQELALEAVPAATSVLGVAGHRVPDRGEVDPDLVRAPGLEACRGEGVGRQGLDHLEVGAGLTGACALDRALGALPPVAPEGGVDRPRSAVEVPLNH